MLKKIIKSSLIALAFSATASYAQNAAPAQCAQPTDRDYAYLLINVLRTNNTNSPNDFKKIDNLLSYYCYNLTQEKGIENPIFSIYSAETLKIFDSKKINLLGVRSKKHGFDIFSNALFFSEKYKNKEFATSRSNDYSKSYKDLFPQEAVPISFTIKEEQFKALFDVLNEKYKQKNVVSDDLYGNSLLHYVIVTNRPEYLETAMGPYSTSKFSVKNKKGITPLHLMFSPALKGKDVKQLNEKVFSLISDKDILKNRISNMHYHAFANLMKDNNPQFYKMINDKFPLKNDTYQLLEKNIKPYQDTFNQDLDIINSVNFF